MEWKACTTDNWKQKSKDRKAEREKREMKGKRGKDNSNEWGSFCLMGLWEKQIKTKDSRPGKNKNLEKNKNKHWEEKGMKMNKTMSCKMVHTYL